MNGQTVCRSTLRHLTNEETHSPIHLETRRVFDETVASHLGPNATDQDFLEEDLTPDFDHYDNDHDLDPDHGDLEVTPEMGDNYLNAEISVPQGGTLSKGCVTAQKWDKDGNPVGLANANPILNMRDLRGFPSQTAAWTMTDHPLSVPHRGIEKVGDRKLSFLPSVESSRMSELD